MEMKIKPNEPFSKFPGKVNCFFYNITLRVNVWYVYIIFAKYYCRSLNDSVYVYVCVGGVSMYIYISCGK